MNEKNMQNNSETTPPAPPVATPALPAPTVWIGLDWADKKHYLAVLAPGATSPASHSLEQKPAALDQFFLKLHQEHPHTRLGVCIEQARGPVIYALMKYDFVLIYPINPRSLADFRRAFTVSGAKSDPRDGDLLCELGAKHHDRLRALQPEEPWTRQLRLEVEARRGFVDERTALLNQLSATLKSYYPLALELFGEDLGGSMALEFLRRWPNLGKLKTVQSAVLRAFFYKQNSRSEEKIQQRLEAIKSAIPLTEDQAIVSALELKMLCLASQIAAVEKSIGQFDARIQSTFQKHSEAWLFRELPGAGPVLAPRLAALFGTQRENWDQAFNFQCWTGVAPVTKQSGNKATVHFRRARPIFVHQSAIEFAKCSILFCDWARLLYEDQLKKSKSRFAAIRMVAFKWLRILFRCWKDKVAYDEVKYLRSLKRHGIKLYESLYAHLPPEPAN
jgi:transposase